MIFVILELRFAVNPELGGVWMARWTLTSWDDEADVFVIMGPFQGSKLQHWLRALFPDDASLDVTTVMGVHQTIALKQLDSIDLEEGDSVTLPGIPVAGGPLMYIMERLLGSEGCPWDRQQTPLSLLRYLLDESYEASEALICNDLEAFADEMGDVLLQVAFQGALLPNTSFAEIAKRQAQKLVRRHPHVFTGDRRDTSLDVRSQWDKIKAKEPKRERSASWVYPSLVAAQRAAKSGIIPKSSIYQEFLDLIKVYFDKNPGKIEETLADAAWAIAEGGRIHHQDAEWALWKKVASISGQNAEISRKLR